MKNAKSKAAALLLTVAVLVCAVLPAGCSSREAKDIEEIEETTQQFIEAFAAGNSDDVEDLIDGDFSYGYKDKDRAEIMLRIASKTEIESFKSVEVDRSKGTAKARFKVSYIESYQFSAKLSTSYLSKDEYLNEIDDYGDRDTKYVTLYFVFDDDDGRWLIKESSADKYKELFSAYYWISLASMSGDEAKAAFEGVIDGLARGELEQEYFIFYPDSVRVFDDGLYEGPNMDDAVMEFIKAYYSYIVDQGINYDYYEDYPYRVIASGSAPSKEAILDYIAGDECVTEMYMASIRTASVVNAYTDEEIWGQFYEGIYYDLAKQIPYMESEPYYVELSVEPLDEFPAINAGTELFPISENDVYVASLITDDKDLRCRQKAVEALYYAGELTKQMYDAYMEDIERDRNAMNDPSGANSSTAKYINWEGTEHYSNNAVNVYEYIPEWSDGTLIYGASDIDEDGIFMHYSKEPGWLNTAGYNISSDGITVMVTFDHKFKKGTQLEYDWYIDGDHYGDKVEFTVEEDGTVEFEFTLEGKDIRKYGTCELRLWEEGQ